MDKERVATGYGRGELRRFPAYRTTGNTITHPPQTSAVTPPASLVTSSSGITSPVVHRSKGQFLVGLLFVSLCGYGGYELWQTFWRYEAFGTVVGRSIGIFGPWDGVVRYVHVTEGQSIRQGQLLVTLDNTELRRELERNEGELKLAQADFEAASSRLQWQSSQQRDIYQESVADYYKALADLMADEAKLGEAKVQHERIDGLHYQGIVTSSEMEKAAFDLQGQNAYSTPLLPLIPRQGCHPFHGKAATDSTARLPPLEG